MKAMLLAAGLGERMRPLTDHTPKPLLRVGGRPLLDYHLTALAAAGVRHVVVNAAWLAEQIIDFCGDGSRWGLEISLSREPEPLETAGGIVEALPRLGDAPFLLVNGDVFASPDYVALQQVALRPAGAHLLLVPNPAHHPMGDFAMREDRIILPEPHAQTLTYAGIGVFQASFFAGARRGKQPLRPWLERAIARAALTGERFGGDWVDVGTPERLAALDAALRPSA
jgi:MurNAc alpha-1-phosphate uridylyltransferase